MTSSNPITFCQATSGSTSCDGCTAGNFCSEGASALLPCPAGRYSGRPGVGTSTNCSVSPVGSSASAGSTAPQLCSPGFYAAATAAATCDTCGAGTFQAAKGTTACGGCSAGSFPTRTSPPAPPHPHLPTHIYPPTSTHPHRRKLLCQREQRGDSVLPRHLLQRPRAGICLPV